MTLDEFKEFNKSIGNHWFSDDTMSFFKSKIHDFDESSGMFITSEQGPDDIRGFSIRKADFQTGRVSTVGKFMEYKNLLQARTKFKKIIIKV